MQGNIQDILFQVLFYLRRPCHQSYRGCKDRFPRHLRLNMFRCCRFDVLGLLQELSLMINYLLQLPLLIQLQTSRICFHMSHVQARFFRHLIGLKSFQLFNSLPAIGRWSRHSVTHACQALQPTKQPSRSDSDGAGSVLWLPTQHDI